MHEFFVIDNIDESKRIKCQEEIPFGYLPLREYKSNLEIELCFFQKCLEYDEIKFKKFIQNQIKNSPNKENLLDFINYKLKTHVKAKKAGYEIFNSPSSFGFYTALCERINTKLDIIDELVSSYSNKIIGKSGFTASRIARYAHYKSQSDPNFLSCRFPSLNAWDELAKKFGHNTPKNIQLNYNALIAKKLHRKSETVIKDINFIITNMLDDDSSAVQNAKSDLKQLI